MVKGGKIYLYSTHLFIYLFICLFIYLFINIYSSESLENAFLEATKSVFKFLFNAFVILVKKLISVVKHNLARNLYSLLHASNYDKFTVNQIVKLITPFFTQFFEKKYYGGLSCLFLTIYLDLLINE